MIFAAIDLVFVFWFFIMAFPLQKKKTRMVDFVFLWIFLAILKLISFANPYPSIKSFLIPDPLNTNLFFLTGIVLFVLWISRRKTHSKNLRTKAWWITIDDLLDLPPGEFEEMTAELYRARGHFAKRTGASGDHGVDVIVKSKDGKKMVIQCKRWRRPVGESIVREFYGTMQHEKAGYGTIFATYGFSEQAKTWAKGKPIALYDGKKFLEMWQQLKDSNEKQHNEMGKE